MSLPLAPFLALDSHSRCLSPARGDPPAQRSGAPAPLSPRRWHRMGAFALLLAMPAALRTPRLRAMPAAHAARLRSPVRLLASQVQRAYECAAARQPVIKWPILALVSPQPSSRASRRAPRAALAQEKGRSWPTKTRGDPGPAGGRPFRDDEDDGPAHGR